MDNIEITETFESDDQFRKWFELAKRPINKNKLDEELVEVTTLITEIQDIRDGLYSSTMQDDLEFTLWESRQYMTIKHNPREWGITRVSNDAIERTIKTLKNYQSYMGLLVSKRSMDNKYKGLLKSLYTRKEVLISLVSLFRASYYNESPAVYVENE